MVRVVDLLTLVPYRCGFESRHGLWIHSYEEAFQLCALYQTRLVPDLYPSRYVILTMLVRRKNQPNVLESKPVSMTK